MSGAVMGQPGPFCYMVKPRHSPFLDQVQRWHNCIRVYATRRMMLAGTPRVGADPWKRLRQANGDCDLFAGGGPAMSHTDYLAVIGVVKGHELNGRHSSPSSVGLSSSLRGRCVQQLSTALTDAPGPERSSFFAAVCSWRIWAVSNRSGSHAAGEPTRLGVSHFTSRIVRGQLQGDVRS
jgi:hypothetical protein